MPTVKHFEELVIWQSAREQCRELQPFLTNGLLSKDWALRDQLARSTGSVMDNIAEGFDRFTRADFRHFLIIARGSNAEVRSQLYRALDYGYLTEEIAKNLIQNSISLGVKITNLINYLDRSPYKSKTISTSNHISEPHSSYASLNVPNEHLALTSL